jgi:uncharacterized protein YbcC (UPF0753/DUF2309 family)
MNYFIESMDSSECLEFLRHHLPKQGMLKDFVHHNPLHAFDVFPFHTATTIAANMFGYQPYMHESFYKNCIAENKINPKIYDKVKSKFATRPPEEIKVKKIGLLREKIKNYLGFNLDTDVHPLLFRLACSYMDRGIATWPFPRHPDGFLESVKALPGVIKSTSIFEYWLNPNVPLEELTYIILGDNTYHSAYLIDQQFAHPGWSGMVSIDCLQTKDMQKYKPIQLEEFIRLELILELSAIDNRIGIKNYKAPSKSIFIDSVKSFSVAIDSRAVWHEALEWTYYDNVISTLCHAPRGTPISSPVFQAIFCLDDREGSIRRHIETLCCCETFGTAGYFNLPIFYRPAGSNELVKSCPAPVTPTHIISAYSGELENHKSFGSNFMDTNGNGWISNYFGIRSAMELILSIFYPMPNKFMVRADAHLPVNTSLKYKFDGSYINDLKEGFTPDEAADVLFAFLSPLGIKENFASIIYLIGHGASSVNNTHYAAYDCGACSGRAGSVNARTAAALANDIDVREKLRVMGIEIPDKSWFIGGIHDTTRDEFTFYDISLMPSNVREEHNLHLDIFRQAARFNAKERALRLTHIDSTKKSKIVHKKVKLRAQMLFEPRPEWNHAGNAICLVGSRQMHQNVFFDRRAFMQSYDPLRDPDGLQLADILKAITPVCGGINLEYYFSKTDNESLGAGTKLSHNVMGLLGVANGMDGDLLPGLPAQMIDIHDAVRLLMIIEQNPETVLKAISDQSIRIWFENEWIFLSVLNPIDNRVYNYKDGQFMLYEPVNVDFSYIPRKKVFGLSAQIPTNVAIIQ